MPSHPPPKSNYSEVRKAEQVERDAAQEAADQRRKAAKERESSWPVHARRVDNQSADTVWRVTIEAAHTTAVVAKDVIGLSLLAYVVGSPNTSHPERPAPVQATSISQQVGHARLLFAS